VNNFQFSKDFIALFLISLSYGMKSAGDDNLTTKKTLQVLYSTGTVTVLVTVPEKCTCPDGVSFTPDLIEHK
jgi:hypothetical protein